MTTNAAPSRPPMELWHRALTDPSLRDLPYKVETNEHGQLVLSPHKPRHSLQQARVAALLRELAPAAGLPPGEAATEFAVETSGGIKVPDVVWISNERLAGLPDDAEASPVMPEIVVEVLCRSNTRTEMEEKRRLYFAAGAREVWMCDPEGRLTFFGAEGEVPASELIPSFPTLVA
ncbi:MAG TPA: Uma2 family endonuclease [Longimicrobiaceae bacterium]|nr:Uma2 family endonuclease [Longimicrobiaceae bacterium]